jgi:hypothetical protein
MDDSNEFGAMKARAVLSTCDMGMNGLLVLLSVGDIWKELSAIGISTADVKNPATIGYRIKLKMTFLPTSNDQLR